MIRKDLLYSLSLDSKLLQVSSYCARIINVLLCYTLLTRERERERETSNKITIFSRVCKMTESDY